jgi:hypothetical protein
MTAFEGIQLFKCTLTDGLGAFDTEQGLCRIERLIFDTVIFPTRRP